MERIAFFESLLNDRFKTPEDIYNTMLEWYPDTFKTTKIMRRHKKWSDCIYQGAIGQDDFVVSVSHASSVEPDVNVQMVVDDYKETIIRFIEDFRVCYNYIHKNNTLLDTIINYMPKFLAKEFRGTSRLGIKTSNERDDSSYLDEKSQMKTYKMSDCKGNGRYALSCERNTTAGNILQFIGCDILQVSGTLTEPKDYAVDSDDNQFILFKIHNGEYTLLDFFNKVTAKNVLPENYDFSKGFSINVHKPDSDINLIYEVDGPLYKMTPDILNAEAILRGLNRRYNNIDKKYRSNQGIDIEGELIPLRQEYNDLLELITNSDIEEDIKNRLTMIANDYIYNLNKIEKRITGNHGYQLK